MISDHDYLQRTHSAAHHTQICIACFQFEVLLLQNLHDNHDHHDPLYYYQDNHHDHHFHNDHLRRKNRDSPNYRHYHDGDEYLDGVHQIVLL